MHKSKSYIAIYCEDIIEDKFNWFSIDVDWLSVRLSVGHVKILIRYLKVFLMNGYPGHDFASTVLLNKKMVKIYEKDPKYGCLEKVNQNLSSLDNKPVETEVDSS